MTVVAFFRLCSHTELFKDYSRTHFIDRLFICHDVYFFIKFFR